LQIGNFTFSLARQLFNVAKELESRRYQQVCLKINHKAHLLPITESWPVKVSGAGMLMRITTLQKRNYYHR